MRSLASSLAALCLVFSCGLSAASAAPPQGSSAYRTGGGGGDSQIDESSPDVPSGLPGAPVAAGDLPARLREFVAGSLAKYDDAKNNAAGFRRQGWYPSFFLRDPEQDVVLESDKGAKTVTVHLSYARRDIEQRMIVAPGDRLVLPGADRRFFVELLAALATAAPEIAHSRLRLWFAVLQPDGEMSWESRGALGISASIARRFPAGARTVEAIWPLLEENGLPPESWRK